MDISHAVMYKTNMTIRLPVYNEERFRTPLAQERELGLWVDRIGRKQADRIKPAGYRRLGQYAAVAVEAGEGVIEILQQGIHAVGAGDVLLLMPRDACLYYPVQQWDTRWVVWNGPEAQVLEQFSLLGKGVPVVRGGGWSVLAAWQRLDPLMERQDFDAILHRKMALLELIRDLAGLHQRSALESGSRFIERALRGLGTGAGAPETMSAIAERMNMSPAHFRRLFKAGTGTSPKAFQQSLRVTRAKELLAAGRSIKETADILGFLDVFHFMRVFRKVAGMTAGRFIESCRC